MRRLFLVALVAGALGFGALGPAHADQLPAGVEGCVATSPGTNGPTALYNGGCQFVATRTGGFVAGAQSWSVVVYNNNTATKVVVGNFSGTGPGCNIAAYVPGNLVVVTVSNGEVAAGNPIPSATDGTIPSGGDRCKQ